MCSRGGSDAGTSRRKRSGTDAAGIPGARIRGNADKALVMAFIGELVAAGHAELHMRDNGEAEVRFASGEIYLLTEATILRLA